MKLTRRQSAALIPLCLALAAGPGFAAEPYPARPVTVMVPYPAGGLSDSIARALSTPLGKALGQPVIVENLGGASGALAAQKLLNAPADGYMVFLGSPGELILPPLANAAIKYRTEDFRMLTQLTINPLVLVARKDLPANNVDELVALGRKPGAKPFAYGSVGFGSMYHLIAEDMAAQTGMAVTHVPYKGMAPLIQDMGGDNIDFAVLPYATSFRGMADTGRMKLLGWVGDQRSALDKRIPAFGEGQSLKHFNYQTWAGIMVRKGTPEDVVQRLHKALAETILNAEYRKALEATGSEIAPLNALADASRLMDQEAARFRAIARAIKLEPQ
ncbi:ABC transporter substrate-binding protein [Rhodoferax koreense]|uniref:ABC transporter substrate-binding protein n=1 Tax=Rhodoferax koreensis TaxID=1842727 RepID=A0A1P8JYQ7_9BURK|nr:tripartite tricarboxylate transporter substrate binding protein [Rhodoferax koreense]APW38892.1 ABC transporter substrate-binding protein [Rhodoferax koreense]